MDGTLTSLLYRMGGDLPAVLVELLLIGLCVNWCASVLEGTRGTKPLRGVLVILVVATIVVRILVVHFEWVRLELLYHYVLTGLALIALVVFQPELRRAVIRMGDVRFRRGRQPESQLVSALVKSAGYLSRNRYGALVAIQRDVDLTGWAENGTMINAEASANLLNTIFYPGSALHDLGVIVRGNHVLAANCQFPSPDSDEIDAALGSRHLAAVGMSYETDALVLVVSEETGVISLADNGKLTRYLTLDDLAAELTNRLGRRGSPAAANPTARSGPTLWHRLRRLLVVVPITAVLWYLADQATFAQATVKLELTLQHDDPTYIVDVLEQHGPTSAAAAAAPPRPLDQLHAASAVFDTTFRGSARKIDQLRNKTPGQILKLVWILRGADAEPGIHVLQPDDLKERIDGLREVLTAGLAVDPSAFLHLRYSVDQRSALRMRVQPDAGETPIAVERIVPPEVTVVFRLGELERYLGRRPERAELEKFAAERFVRAPLGDLLTGLGPEETRTLEVQPEGAVGSLRVAGMSPQKVTLTVGVVGQRRAIPNVVVQLFVSPEVREKCDVEKVDANEWRIDVEVSGRESKIRGLGPADVQAFVHVTPDMIPPADQAAEKRLRSLDVIILAPEGVHVVTGRPRTVRVNLVPRPGATP